MVFNLVAELFQISVYLGLAGVVFIFGANLVKFLVDVVASFSVLVITIISKILG